MEENVPRQKVVREGACCLKEETGSELDRVEGSVPEGL